MEKRYFIIILFVALFAFSAYAIFTDNPLTKFSDSLNKDKIKLAVQNTVAKASENVSKSAPIIAENIKEASASAINTIEDKGGELLQSAVINPASDLAKTIVKKALTSASSTILNDKDIEEILKNNGDNSCTCK